MRVLVLTQYFWPETFPISAEAARLRDRGHEVTVLTGKPNYPGGRILPGYRLWGVQREHHQGCEIIRLPLIPRGASGSVRLALNYLSFVLFGLVLGPIVLRRKEFDAILVYAPSPLLQAIPALLIARLKHAAVLVWVQDLWPESLSATGAVRNPRVLAAVRWIVKRIYLASDLILVPSRGFIGPIADIAEVGERLRYVPNPVPALHDGSGPDPAVAALATRIAEGFSVVFAGNFGRAQALDTVVEAAGYLRDVPGLKIYLIGSGRIENDLRTAIRSSRLENVILPGRFGPEAMPTLLSAAGALLVSLRDEEIFGYTVPSKLQAYLATGRPIIAALAGEGARLLGEAGAGLVCPPGDAEALARAIRDMAGTAPKRRSEMGAAGRSYFDANFAPDTVTTALAARIKEAVSSRVAYGARK